MFGIMEVKVIFGVDGVQLEHLQDLDGDKILQAELKNEHLHVF